MADQIGEVLPDMTRKWQEEFAMCVNIYRGRREPYYIMTSFEWRRNYTQFVLKLKPTDYLPSFMLKTMLHKVDNVTGRIDEVWVLPVDAPVGPMVPLGDVDEGLIKLAPHLPLLYN
jgi:hypothetical protein